MTTLYVDNIAPNLQSRVSVPGHVIQVVQGTSFSTTQVSSATPSTVGLEATITPSSTSSKILVLVNAAGDTIDTGGALSVIGYLFRNSTELNRQGWTYDSGNRQISNIVISYLDSPSSTSALTYDLRITSGSTSTIGMYGNDVMKTITLMEIAG
jgi:hypothetical protein